ncbi:MAG: hypothetical protein ACREVZ_17090 [Burkholderiales bacterium]
MPALGQRDNDPSEHWQHLLRRHSVQHVANLVIRGDRRHAEQGPGVAVAQGLRHGGLMRKKRRTLGAKNTEDADDATSSRLSWMLRPVRLSGNQRISSRKSPTRPPKVKCALRSRNGYANVAAWLFVDLPCCYTEAAGFCSAVYAAELSK